MIDRTYYRDVIEIRSDIGLAFMESGMKHGPQFIRDSLHKVASAYSYVTPCRTPSEPTKRLSLYSPIFHTWPWKLLGDSGLIIAKETLDNPREFYRRTIISHLREACADRIGCGQDEVMSRIWRMVRLPEHRLAWLSRSDRASLVLGLPLDGKVRVEESD